MSSKLKKSGFSLTEVLLAVATLAIGMIFINGTFLAGIYLSTIATERTIAAVVADEAFAKIRLYGINFDPSLWQGNGTYPVNTNLSVDYNEIVDIMPFDPNEFAYPSTKVNVDKQYYWSALCRLVNKRNEPDDPNRLVQVTVFVGRKVGSGTRYPGGATWPVPVQATWPVPVQVGVEESVDPDDPTKSVKNILRIIARPPDVSGDMTLINDGSTIADDNTGRLYRVLKRYAAPNDSVIKLDRDWDNADQHGNFGENPPDSVWVIPPPVGGGRYPCIAVYQKVIRF